jgi:hypothetical protein
MPQFHLEYRGVQRGSFAVRAALSAAGSFSATTLATLTSLRQSRPDASVTMATVLSSVMLVSFLYQ